jgi:hypothetical protein
MPMPPTHGSGMADFAPRAPAKFVSTRTDRVYAIVQAMTAQGLSAERPASAGSRRRRTSSSFPASTRAAL